MVLKEEDERVGWTTVGWWEEDSRFGGWEERTLGVGVRESGERDDERGEGTGGSLAKETKGISTSEGTNDVEGGKKEKT